MDVSKRPSTKLHHPVAEECLSPRGPAHQPGDDFLWNLVEVMRLPSPEDTTENIATV
jgi:hypothetical protein